MSTLKKRRSSLMKDRSKSWRTIRNINKLIKIKKQSNIDYVLSTRCSIDKVNCFIKAYAAVANDEYYKETFISFDSDSEAILIDTGASCSITHSRSDFTTYEPYLNKKQF